MTSLLFVTGLVLLVAGGELLVRGAARLAARTGISPLIIGLTVVAFGTSSPELAVSIQASLGGAADIAVGNVVGSNIFNILVILGLSAAVVPLAVSTQLVRLDVPVMIGVSILFLLLAMNGTLGRIESAVLVAGLGGYIAIQILISRRAAASIEEDGRTAAAEGSAVANLLLILGGLGLLMLGSRWLVQASVLIAQHFGITPLVIGLTIVAAGTSMPELATSIVAGIRGQRDIAVGNVVGSNIFNILAVLGLTGVVSPFGIPVSTAALTMDIPVMVAVAVICLPIFFSGYTIRRLDGLLFLACYVLYTVYLALDASDHGGLHEYRTIVLTVVLPLTLLMLAVTTVRARRSRRSSGTS